MEEPNLLENGLAACGGNQNEMARRLGVDRQLIQAWRKAGRLPKGRRKQVADMIAASANQPTEAAPAAAGG